MVYQAVTPQQRGSDSNRGSTGLPMLLDEATLAEAAITWALPEDLIATAKVHFPD